MSAFDPKRTSSSWLSFENLAEFDDLDLAVAARLALERALIVVCIVGLDAGQPHRCAASGTIRVFDFLVRPFDERLLHRGSPVIGGSAAVSLSHRRLRQSLGR